MPGSRATQSEGKILVVDDEVYITDLLGTALRFVGFEVQSASSGFEALRKTSAFAPDLMVLDVMLPDIDGFEVCRRLRADNDPTPVIFLTARDAPTDVVSGFTKGGDDYVTKPFDLEEIIARIGAVLRRSGHASAAAARNHHTFSDLELDETAHRVTRGGQPVELSPTEYKLLRYFMLNPERVLSKAQILDHVWQYDFQGDVGVVETYMSYLRKKVDSGDRVRLLHTVRGVGYVLRSEP